MAASRGVEVAIVAFYCFRWKKLIVRKWFMSFIFLFDRKGKRGMKPLLCYSTMVISSSKWPQLPNLSMMKST